MQSPSHLSHHQAKTVLMAWSILAFALHQVTFARAPEQPLTLQPTLPIVPPSLEGGSQEVEQRPAGADLDERPAERPTRSFTDCMVLVDDYLWQRCGWRSAGPGDSMPTRSSGQSEWTELSNEQRLGALRAPASALISPRSYGCDVSLLNRQSDQFDIGNARLYQPTTGATQAPVANLGVCRRNGMTAQSLIQEIRSAGTSLCESPNRTRARELGTLLNVLKNSRGDEQDERLRVYLGALGASSLDPEARNHPNNRVFAVNSSDPQNVFPRLKEELLSLANRCSSQLTWEAAPSSPSAVTNASPDVASRERATPTPRVQAATPIPDQPVVPTGFACGETFQNEILALYQNAHDHQGSVVADNGVKGELTSDLCSRVAHFREDFYSQCMRGRSLPNMLREFCGENNAQDSRQVTSRRNLCRHSVERVARGRGALPGALVIPSMDPSENVHPRFAGVYHARHLDCLCRARTSRPGLTLAQASRVTDVPLQGSPSFGGRCGPYMSLRYGWITEEIGRQAENAAQSVPVPPESQAPTQ